MHKNIKDSIEKLLLTHPKLKGGYTSLKEFEKLDKTLKDVLPEWYIEFLTNYSIANIKIGIPFNYGWESLKGKPREELPLMNTFFKDIQAIEESAVDLFPGFELIKENYFCIAAADPDEGDGFYINASESNPKVVYVYHDCGESVEELIENGQLIADSFSDFLDIIKIIKEE